MLEAAKWFPLCSSFQFLRKLSEKHPFKKADTLYFCSLPQMIFGVNGERWRRREKRKAWESRVRWMQDITYADFTWKEDTILNQIMQIQVTWDIRRGPWLSPRQVFAQGPCIWAWLAGNMGQERRWPPPTLYKATGTRQCGNEMRIKAERQKQTHAYCRSTDFQ